MNKFLKLCLIWILMSPTALMAEKYALIFGTNYQGASPINDLELCETDANLMAEQIFKTGSFKKENVKMFLADQVTRDNIKSAIEDWLGATVKADDQVFFYFSGHGSFVRDSAAKNGMTNILVMFNRPHVSDDELSQWLSKIQTKKTVIILDCCFSGGLAKKGSKVRGDANIPIPDGADSTVLQDVGTPFFQDKVVVASSDDNETSIELGKPIDHGLFTYYFSKAMLSADLNEDKKITAYEAFFKARDLTTSQADKVNHKQHPQISGDASGFFFVGSAGSDTHPDVNPDNHPVDPVKPDNPDNPNTDPPVTPDEPVVSPVSNGSLVLNTTYRKDVMKGQTPSVSFSGKNLVPQVTWQNDVDWGETAIMTFSKVPAGVQNVEIKAKGYPDKTIKTGIEKNQTTTERIVIARSGRGSIDGHVWVENFTQPFANLMIFLSPIRIPKQPKVRSKQDGSFVFNELKPGKYRVFIVGGIGFFTKPYNAYIEVKENEVTKIEIVLKESFKK